MLGRIEAQVFTE